jgi:hypothetical protein
MSISVTAKDVSPVEKMFNHLISGPTENKPFLHVGRAGTGTHLQGSVSRDYATASRAVALGFQ